MNNEHEEEHPVNSRYDILKEVQELTNTTGRKMVDGYVVPSRVDHLIAWYLAKTPWYEKLGREYGRASDIALDEWFEHHPEHTAVAYPGPGKSISAVARIREEGGVGWQFHDPIVVLDISKTHVTYVHWGEVYTGVPLWTPTVEDYWYVENDYK